jgi:hypothetical protein
MQLDCDRIAIGLRLDFEITCIKRLDFDIAILECDWIVRLD